jgi:hypothetical protein
MVDPKIAQIAEYIRRRIPLGCKLISMHAVAGCSWLLSAVVARCFFYLCCSNPRVSAAETGWVAVFRWIISGISGGSVNIDDVAM